MTVRGQIINELRLLASPSEQLNYERSLTTGGHAPSELVTGFCDDLYQPKSQQFVDAFSLDELRDLAHLYGLVAEASRANHATVALMLKDPNWRRVVQFAKELSSRVGAPRT
jgi:hypothetical protein